MSTTMVKGVNEGTEEKKKTSDLDIVFSVLAYLVRDGTIARCKNIKGQLQRDFSAHKDHYLVKDRFYFKRFIKNTILKMKLLDLKWML